MILTFLFRGVTFCFEKFHERALTLQRQASFVCNIHAKDWAARNKRTFVRVSEKNQKIYASKP